MNIRGLDRALNALSPYLDDLVVCGAWAWYLYRRVLAPDRPILSVFTQDVDCIGREGLPVRGRPLWDVLEAHDFEWVPRGDDSPPAEKYVWPDRERPEVEIEFLAPVHGGDRRRAVEIQNKIVAQAVRNLDILIDRPTTIHVGDDSPVGHDVAFRGTVLVPRIGHFVVQKALIHERRTRSEKIADMVYVFDLLDSANGLADVVLEDVLAARRSWSREVDRFRNLLDRTLQDGPFMTAVSKQFPEEGGATPPYIGYEVASWIGRLDASLREAGGPTTRRGS